MTKVQVNYRASAFSFMSRLDPLTEKVYSFQNLRDGWHYGRGRAPSRAVIISSLYFVNRLREMGASVIEVFPGIEGTILVSAYADDICIDVSVHEPVHISKNGAKVVGGHPLIDYVVEQNDIEIAAEKGVQFHTLVEKIERERWLTCDSSGSFTRSTIASNYPGLSLWHSETRTEPVYPSLCEDA